MGVSAISYILAVVVSLIMHGTLIFFLTQDWQSQNTELQITRPPQVIQASLVELEAKAAPKKTESKVVDLTAQRRREQEAQARKEAERKRVAAEKKAAEEAEKKKREQEEEQKRLREEQDRIAREQAEQRRLEEFNNALAEEEGYEANIASQEVVAGITATIAQQAANQFNPPPSARRGMVATVRVNMVPTGRVIQVDIIESSGNGAFDRAVIQAVQKAQPFDIVKTLDSRVFEQNFRQFSFKFNPQNLRL